MFAPKVKPDDLTNGASIPDTMFAGHPVNTGITNQL
jgi:hypothetical protein